MILLERLNTLKNECAIDSSPGGSVSSAKELESSRNTKMPLWPVKVGVNGCVPSTDALLHCFLCDPTVLPSYFPLALLAFIAPQLNRMTRQSCTYCEISCDFLFPSRSCSASFWRVEKNGKVIV